MNKEKMEKLEEQLQNNIKKEIKMNKLKEMVEDNLREMFFLPTETQD